MSRSFQEIKKSGRLRVAVSREIRGYSCTDDDGARAGFDIDLSVALGHALFGSSDGIEFVETAPSERLSLLTSGAVDLGLFNLSASLGRIHGSALLPMVPYLYDSEAALIGANRKATLLKDLSSPVIAVQKGTTSQANIARYLGGRPYSILEYSTHADALDAYETSIADAYVLDACSLYMAREQLNRPGDHRVSDDPISIESLIAGIRIDSVALGVVFHAVLSGLLAAEDLGRSDRCPERYCAEDVSETLATPELVYGNETLLSEGYVARVLTAVGDYRHVYERNFRLANGELVPRANNSLVRDGGLHVPIPIH